MKKTDAKKTIVLTILRGTVARNLLQSKFIEKLRDRYRVVIFTPAAADYTFLRQFAHPHIEFVRMNEIPHTRVDQLFVSMQRYLIFNEFTGLKVRYGIRGVSKPGDANALKYYAYRMVFGTLAKLRFLRDIVRFFDYHFVQRHVVDQFRHTLRDLEPAVLVSTSIMSNVEIALMKAARREKIPIIGMPKTWDSPSKGGLRIKPDRLVVWSNFMVRQSVTFQNYNPTDISVIGVPQFDHYTEQKHVWERAKFFQEFQLDPNKKVILYTSAGKGVPEDKDIVAYVVDFLKQQRFAVPSQLLIRPHNKYKNDQGKFMAFAGVPDVSIDLQTPETLSVFRDNDGFGMEDIERLINTLYYADVVVNVASTITLDAAALGKPSVHPMLKEPVEGKMDGETYLMFYRSDYVQAMQATGAAIAAHNKNELLEAINIFLRDANHNARERQWLVKEFCYKIDGKAGERFADIIIDTAQ